MARQKGSECSIPVETARRLPPACALSLALFAIESGVGSALEKAVQKFCNLLVGGEALKMLKEGKGSGSRVAQRFFKLQSVLQRADHDKPGFWAYYTHLNIKVASLDWPSY
jgi:hypothetical protein